MTFQSVEEAHLAALTALFTQALPQDHICRGLLREKIWLDPDFVADWALVATHQGKLSGFGMAVLRLNTIGYLKLIAIAPPFQHKGLGKQLLTQLEHKLTRAGATGIRLAESAPNYLWPGVDVRYQGARRFFERNGYRPMGSTQNLTVDLKTGKFHTADHERHLANRGFGIHRAAPEHQGPCLAMLDRFWPSWQAEVNQAFSNRPISLHLARIHGKVVAFAAYDTNNLHHGWFGPMGTDPDFRGLGLGAVLLKRCLTDLAEQGSTRAVIPWVGPEQFYRHHVGALPAQSFIRYQKPV